MNITGVFNIEKRGRVITTKDCPRGVRMGSLLTRGLSTWQVTGIETFNPTPTDGTVGLLIRGDAAIKQGDEVEHYDSWARAAISAHRNLSAEGIKRVERNIIALTHLPNLETVYVGGARGGDTIALRILLGAEQMKKRPHPVVIVPDTVSNQPADAQEWIKRAGEVIELKNPITEEDKFASYKIRNERLIQDADVLFAFFSGNYKSGTGHAIRTAERTGKRVVIIPVGVQ